MHNHREGNRKPFHCLAIELMEIQRIKKLNLWRAITAYVLKRHGI